MHTVPIGISDDHVELADAFGKWAASLGGIEAARAAEGDPAATFPEITAAVEEMGLLGITSDGGSLTDLAVAVEACATALLPGPLLGSAVASVVLPGLRGSGAPGPVALCLDGFVVHDGPGATHALVVVDDEVRLVPLEGVDLSP